MLGNVHAKKLRLLMLTRLCFCLPNGMQSENYKYFQAQFIVKISPNWQLLGMQERMVALN